MRIKQEALGEREAERYVRLRRQADGTVKVEAVLSADEAEVLEKALRQARSQQAAEPEKVRRDSSAEEREPAEPRERAEQRDRERADSLVPNQVMVERAAPAARA